MKKSCLSRSNGAALALLAAVAIPAAMASAQTTTFPIDGTEGSTTYSDTVNGITLTFSNPTQTENVFAFGLINDPADSGSLDLQGADSGSVFVSAFDFTLTAGAQVVSYTIGVVDNEPIDEASVRPAALPAESFTLSGPDSPDSVGNDLTSTGSHNVVGTFTLNANDVAAFTTDLPDNYFVTLDSITVMVPEPNTWRLLGLASFALVIAGGWRRLRQAGSFLR